ncbi:hypothetical protein QQS21_002295 [Conoideocrella luteorostrata]|uniref:Uncharacterized protein n=1 Tax=Conoideocrella luteorostrata TaxID=1105319 RepID=A0AAJ0FXH2_9HYPO|nr:hypothetical protein QQS21_002295 [Conoideocrella luteorostrata]
MSSVAQLRRPSSFKVLPWAAEFWELGISLSSLIVMLVLLAVYNGQEAFHWHGVTLNAVVALLSVTVKASFTSAVAAAIGEWKWILFLGEEPRLLMDFDRIDLASRGPWGSLAVFFTMANANVLKLGALTTLLALALDPFSQQTIQLRPDVVYLDSPLALNARSEKYYRGNISWHQYNDAKGLLYESVTAVPETSMQAAISMALLNPSTFMNQWAGIQCPAANCTWPAFDSLGVCQKCRDLTSHLVKSDYEPQVPNLSSSSWGLPNGIQLSNWNSCPFNLSVNDCAVTWNEELKTKSYPSAQSYFMGFGTGNPNWTFTMGQLDTLIWSITAVHVDYRKVKDDNSSFIWPDVPVIAKECALYYCVKQISSAVVNGKVTENQIELTDAVRDFESWKPVSQNSSGNQPNQTATSLEFYRDVRRKYDLSLYFPGNHTKPVYNVSDNAVFSLSSYFQSSYAFGYDAHNESYYNDNYRANWNCAVFSKGHRWPPRFGALWGDSRHDLEESFSIIAQTMTNEMRRVSSINASEGYMELDQQSSGYQYPVFLIPPGGRSTAVVNGSRGFPVIRYHVVWGWLSYHVVFFASGVFFFLATLYYSASTTGCMSWKNSSLAVVSLAHKFGKVLDAEDTVWKLEKKAKLKMSTLTEKLPDTEGHGLAGRETEDSPYVVD